MKLIFDVQKSDLNAIKHGFSLDRAAEMVIEAVIDDDRKDYGELRYRAFGTIEGAWYCLAFTVRDDAVRVISLRRAHQKEVNRYVDRND